MKRALLVLLFFCLPFLFAGFSNNSAERINGTNGNYGNEQTLQYLYNLKDVPIWVNGPTYYFSDDADGNGDFAQGDDTNDCLSPATPCTSWAKLQTICPYANCILDAADSQWMTFEDCTDVNDGTAQPQVGGGGADNLCDTDGLSVAGDPEIDQDSGLGDDRPWFTIRSSRPGIPVTITEVDQPTLSVFHVRGGGTIVLQDIVFSAFSTDVIIMESDTPGTDDGTTLVANNIRCTGNTGAASRCFRILGADTIALNSGGYADDSPTVLVSEDGSLTWISTKAMVKTADDTTGAVVSVLSSASPDCCPELTLIGPTVSIIDDVNVALTTGIGIQPDDNTHATVRIARTHITGFENGATARCLMFDQPDADEYTDIEIYQSTFSNCRIALLANDGGEVTNALNRFIARYNVFQTATSGIYGAWFNGGGWLTDGTISIRDSVVNQHSGSEPSFFYMTDEDANVASDATVSDMRDQIALESTDMQTTLADFFVNGITTTNTDQYNGSCVVTPGTGGTGVCICDPSEDCYDAMTSTYTIELVAPIPGEIVGSPVDIEYLTLGDVNTNYGAY